MKQQQSKPLFQALFALLFCGVCASLEDGVVPLMCPGIGEPPLVINDSDLGSFAKINIFEGKDVLCTLIEADLNVVLVAEDGTVSKRDILSLTKNRDYSVSNLKPVGRSYNGNEWEAAPGDFSSLVFDCSFSLYGKGGGGNCLVMLPKPKKGRHYLLKSHDYGHELTPDDLTARFLEKATFGPTKADIEAFTSSEIWMAEQLAWKPTSHRRFFRERATDWFYHTSHSGLLHAGPCERGSRYRNFALTPMDISGFLHVRQSPLDENKLILSVGGHIRTVVDGPMKVAFGWKEDDIEKIDIDEVGMSFEIDSPRPIDGVGGVFSLNIPLQIGGKTTKSSKNVFFGDESGNPRVQFDEAHAVFLENLVVLPNYRYEEVTSQRFFEGNTEVLQLTSDILNGTSCTDLNKELVGFTYPRKATIARTTKNGETRYWIHSPMFNFLSNELDAPLADGGKEAVDRTRNPPSDLAQEIRNSLKTQCSNVPRTFLNEDSCKLADRDACPYDKTADIDKTAGGKVLVCGSPGEAASVHDVDSGTHGRGGFTVAVGKITRKNNKGNLKEQRRNVWAEIALHSKDQLRQKMAYALSQILAIDEDIGTADGTENFVNYYDIFVRNAFGNYFDILKEVTRHPMMARMLTYVDGQSTGYNYIKEGSIQQADENYAREVMQLFSIGLALQNDDGTLKLDNDGNEVATYTNFDISEYAKVYVGLRDQAARGNIETTRNEVDPLRIETSWKDQFPKLGLDSKFIGDGYPLCSDLPHQHFLKKGAKYRILGAKANPDFASEAWSGGAPKRASLDFMSSNLTSIICNKNEVGVCNPQNIVVLPTDIKCFGIECEIEEPRTIEIAEGLWYEYIRPPCVNQAFYNNGKNVYRLSGGGGFKQILCGNPSLRDASTICCKKTEQDMRDATGRKEVFGGERTTFETAVERCIEDDLGICDSIPANKRTLCTVEQDACDLDNVFYWLSAPCSMNAKVSPEGNVAIVHQPSATIDDKENETFAQVSSDTKSFFRTDWRASDVFPTIGSFIDDFDTNCESIEGCFVEDIDGNCQCEVFVEDGIAFDDDSELSSVGKLLSIATFGSFVSDSISFVSTGVSGIKKFPSGPLSINTIFEATDSIGRIHYRKNVLSIVKLGDGSLQMRNPVTFWSLPDATIRDGEYELDAALEHYFFHPNVPSFLAKLLVQRFGSSNPSPRYTKVIANAFKTGKYGNYGSNEYGCLEATIAAIILDREAQDHILDADPIQGQLQGPYMQLMKAMRASEYKSDLDNPIIRFRGEIIDKIGEEPHRMPSVFSFFDPSYVAPGRARAANMFAPEAKVLNGATSMATAIGLMSLFKYGSSQCDYSFFGTKALTKTRPNNVCVIGDDSTNFGNNQYNPADYGLDGESADDVINDLATLMTSGRLSIENRQIIKDAFTETLFNGVTDDLVREALINAQQLVSLSPEFHSNSLSRKRNKNREPPEPKEAKGIPYKAVIQVVLSGGLDSFNVLVPESCTGTNKDGTTVDDQYLEARGALAFDRSKGEFDLTISPNTEQPCERFAIHEELPYIKELYDEKDLLFFANVGVVNENNMNRDNWDAKTKSMLFAHNAMQKEIKKIDPYDSSAGSGILGRLNDLLTTKFNGAVNAIGIVENSIALAGNGAFEVPVSIVGRDGPYEYGIVGRDELWFDIEAKTTEINSEHDAFSGIFGDTWSEALMNGIKDGDRLTKFFANEEIVDLDADIWAKVADEDKISRSFQTLSKLIQTRTDRKVDRDTFTIEFKGFDHHQDMKASLKERLVEVNRNIKRLIEQLKKDGMWDQVTIVVASEFGRSLTPNSGAGADHGWGGNYMVMGGSIDGGRVLGKYPDDFTSKSRLNASRNTRTRFIPTMSWEHIYNGVVGWMADGFNEGLTEDDLDYVLPNRNNCIDPVEGEGSVPLFTAADLYIGARTDTDSNIETDTNSNNRADTDSNIESDQNTQTSTVSDIESSAHESSTRRALTLMVFSCIGFFYYFV